MPKSKPAPRRGRTAQEKLQIVLRAAGLRDDDLGAFLRAEGLHATQLEEWRERAMEGAAEALKGLHAKHAERSPESRRIRGLEREVLRKDRALAEVTALLALKKKLSEIWGDEEPDTSTRNGT